MIGKLINTKSLSFKIMSSIVVMVVLLSVVITVQTRTSMTVMYMEQLEKRGISIANVVAAQSVNLILVNNYYDLHELVKDTQQNNDDVRYVFVISNEGELLAHSFGSGFPKGLLQVNKLNAGEKYNTEVLETEEGVIRDIVVPVMEGRVGYVRVGMTDKTLHGVVNRTTWQLVADTIIVALIGIVLAFILTSRLTRPLRELVHITHAIVAGDLTKRVAVNTGDEIGRLGRAFNAMTEYLFRSNQVQERLLQELKEKEEMRTQLLQKVIVAQEEERKRIARELHDETGQTLTSLMVGLKVLEESCSENTARLRLAEMRETVGQTLEEVHRLAVLLRPSILDDMGLIPALEKYISEYRQSFNIDVDLHVTCPGGKRLAHEVEITVYRIVQEALTNVAKYAKACNASVLIQCSEEELVTIVEDDGVGFDAQQLLNDKTATNKLGLYGMKERATLLGGTFTVESAPGRGTTIYVRIPVRGEVA